MKADYRNGCGPRRGAGTTDQEVFTVYFMPLAHICYKLQIILSQFQSFLSTLVQIAYWVNSKAKFKGECDGLGLAGTWAWPSSGI